MQNNKLIKITYCSALIAVIFLSTTFLRIPLVNGYINLGDCFVLLSSIILGGNPIAFIVSGIGAALADLVAYPHYALVTFVIKSIMSVIVWLFSVKLMKSCRLSFSVGFVLAEIFMTVGYFIYEFIIYGLGVAVINIPWNLLQGLANIVVALLLIKITNNFERFKRR